MGNKIVKIEDSFVSMGGYILSILQKESISIDDLYIEFSEKYPKKEIPFDSFLYAIDFLFMINKIKIKKDDILEVRI
ncbi:MAG TPA: hypothetical protein ENK91_15870 [Bacteroidetes bacterium]|nr:hypothetical protein [Bacteroidota bacterium]